jgi:Fe-S-cluster containining protein
MEILFSLDIFNGFRRSSVHGHLQYILSRSLKNSCVNIYRERSETFRTFMFMFAQVQDHSDMNIQNHSFDYFNFLIKRNIGKSFDLIKFKKILLRHIFRHF